MKTEHTPGPWFYDGANSANAHVIHVAEGEIAETFAEWCDQKVAEANAKLIAAAPEMAEALKIHHNFCIKMQPSYCEHGADAVAYRATCAVLAKAGVA